MRSMTISALALCALGLSACFGPSPQSLQFDPTAPPTLESARTIFSNRTFITHSLHGTQIEYHKPNGRSFLWYPGNLGVVPANWEVRSHLGSSHEICWQYPTSSRNGITGVSSKGRWQCSPSISFYSSVEEVLEGDPFNLASGRVPYRLPRGSFSAQQLTQKAGKSTDALKYVFP
ncbi:MAG: hypothetical protein ABJ246_17225 [Paracoccaceae bacterium]